MNYTDEVLELYYHLLKQADSHNPEAIAILQKIDDTYKKTVTS